MDDKLLIRIKNEISEIAKVSQIFNGFSNQHKLSKKVTNVFDMALDEMLNNIITYGYDDKNEHDIDIEIHLLDQILILKIEDDGHEFNPLDVPEADIDSSMEDRPIGGLGIHLTRNTMDDIHYTYKDKKNCLKMKKKIREI